MAAMKKKAVTRKAVARKPVTRKVAVKPMMSADASEGRARRAARYEDTLLWKSGRHGTKPKDINPMISANSKDAALRGALKNAPKASGKYKITNLTAAKKAAGAKIAAKKQKFK